MNKNTNYLRHSNRQITWGCFPLQCYLAGSWAVLFPAACYICRSALFLFRLPGQLSFSLSWQADSPSHLLVPSSLCLSPSWQITSVFQLQVLCPTYRVSFPLICGLCSPFCLHVFRPQCFSKWTGRLWSDYANARGRDTHFPSFCR